MVALSLPDDIVEGNLAPLFNADGSPRLDTAGGQVCASYTHAAAANWVALTNNGFFTPENLIGIIDRSVGSETAPLVALREYLGQRGSDFNLPELLDQGSLLKAMTGTLTSSQVIEAARPQSLNVWQPVEAALVGEVMAPGNLHVEKRVFLAIRGPHRKDTPGLATFPGGFAKIIAGQPEKPAETARRELDEELGLTAEAASYHDLGIATHNGSPSILPVRTASGKVLAGIVPEFMPAFAALMGHPFYRLQSRLEFNYESVGLLALSASNLIHLHRDGQAKALFLASDAPFARPLTRSIGSLAEISQRIEQAPPVGPQHREQKGGCRPAIWLTVTTEDIDARVRAISALALDKAGLTLPPALVTARNDYIRSNLSMTKSRIQFSAPAGRRRRGIDLVP